MILVLWRRQIMYNFMCSKAVEENVNKRETLNMGNAAQCRTALKELMLFISQESKKRRTQWQDVSSTYYLEKRKRYACLNCHAVSDLRRISSSANTLPAKKNKTPDSDFVLLIFIRFTNELREQNPKCIFTFCIRRTWPGSLNIFTCSYIQII